MPRAVSSPRLRWSVGLIGLLPVLAAIACGGLSAGAPTPTEPGQGAAPTHTLATAIATATAAPPTAAATPTVLGQAATDVPPTQSGEVEIAVDLVFGPGPLIYSDPLTGLAALASYQAALTVTFDGTRDGQPEQWMRSYVMLAANDPPARQWTVETTGSVENPGVVFLAELAGTDYERRGDGACTATAIEEGDTLAMRLELAGFLTGVIGADEAGTETVNDVATLHYTFDQRALGQDGLTTATGELWVAAEDGPIVRYVLTTQGGTDYFGEGLEGTLTVDYALTGLNQPVVFALPADCPPGLVNAPLLPDAANVVNVPGTLAYETATSVAEAAAFYQTQLPSLGWSPSGEPASTDVGSILNFTQGSQQLTVVLMAADGVTRVNMVVEAAGG